MLISNPALPCGGLPSHGIDFGSKPWAKTKERLMQFYVVYNLFLQLLRRRWCKFVIAELFLWIHLWCGKCGQTSWETACTLYYTAEVFGCYRTPLYWRDRNGQHTEQDTPSTLRCRHSTKTSYGPSLQLFVASSVDCVTETSIRASNCSTTNRLLRWGFRQSILDLFHKKYPIEYNHYARIR